MTETTETSTALVLPGTGEVIDLDNPDEVAVCIARLKELRTQIGDAEIHLKRAMLDARAREGVTSKLRLPSAEVTFGSDLGDLTWDLTVLRELRAAGLPDGRWDALVTTTIDYKVSATVAKQIEDSGNPEYAAIIGRARGRGPNKVRSVSVALRAAS